jgi:hypothetical protein
MIRMGIINRMVLSLHTHLMHKVLMIIAVNLNTGRAFCCIKGLFSVIKVLLWSSYLLHGGSSVFSHSHFFMNSLINGLDMPCNKEDLKGIE